MKYQSDNSEASAQRQFALKGLHSAFRSVQTPTFPKSTFRKPLISRVCTLLHLNRKHFWPPARPGGRQITAPRFDGWVGGPNPSPVRDERNRQFATYRDTNLSDPITLSHHNSQNVRTLTLQDFSSKLSHPQFPPISTKNARNNFFQIRTIIPARSDSRYSRFVVPWYLVFGIWSFRGVFVLFAALSLLAAE
jgi:hypothetical protein